MISPKRFALLPETPTMTRPDTRATQKRLLARRVSAARHAAADRETAFPVPRLTSWQIPTWCCRLMMPAPRVITSKSPEDFARFMKEQNDRFAKVIQAKSASLRNRAMLKIIFLGDDIGLEVVPEAIKVMQAAAARTGLAVESLLIGRSGHEDAWTHDARCHGANPEDRQWLAARDPRP